METLSNLLAAVLEQVELEAVVRVRAKRIRPMPPRLPRPADAVTYAEPAPVVSLASRRRVA